MRIGILILLLIVSVPALTQQSKQAAFGSIIQAGYQQGSSGAYFGVQAINGIHYRTWYTGIGAGIDYYYFRSVPLFIDLRKDLVKKPATPLVYLDLGANIPWNKKNDFDPVGISYKHGIYYDLGIGYKTPVRKKLFLIMSAGYSEKQMKERIENWSTPGGHQEITYVLRKINLKIGLGF